MKANPMPAVVGFMAGLVDGIDVASGGELKVALDAGADPQEVSFAGPGKRDAELRQAVASRVLVNVESKREVGVLAQVSQALGLPARVAVRVNPDFELKGSGMKMGGGPKQFGVDVEQMPALLADVGRAGLAFEGFHLFAGSQNLRSESICEARNRIGLAPADMPGRWLSQGVPFCDRPPMANRDGSAGLLGRFWCRGGLWGGRPCAGRRDPGLARGAGGARRAGGRGTGRVRGGAQAG